MEDVGMEVATGAKIHLTSAAAFVEGGSQDALGDACSICLEAFCESDPSTVTSCKHEFHLQCVLEWCQRSSNCPMCWQAISLKDPSSQELLETVERERIQRSKPVRNTAVFRHATLGDFELQNLPLGVDASELEDRIMQHLAAATAVGRTRRFALAREGTRSNTSLQNNPHLLVSSANPNVLSAAPGSNSGNEPASSMNNRSRSVYVNQTIQPVCPNDRNRGNELSMDSNSAGSSESQSISEKWKSQFSSLSMKYKESISRSTREWKEKLFSRSTTMPGIGTDILREVNAGVASVSRMMERMDTRENQPTPVNPTTQNNNDNGQTTSDGPETRR